ncbi:MAG: hypothetical protein H7099_15785 [Gemmatimonadaceae bacterium]|nr:hypothetical protein [Gemmatimonadaceae bacterium]
MPAPRSAAAGTPPPAAGPGAEAPAAAVSQGPSAGPTTTTSFDVAISASPSPDEAPAVAIAGTVVQLTETYHGDAGPIPPFTDMAITEPELSRLRKLGIVIDPDAPAIVASIDPVLDVDGIVSDDDDDEDDDE